MREERRAEFKLANGGGGEAVWRPGLPYNGQPCSTWKDAIGRGEFDGRSRSSTGAVRAQQSADWEQWPGGGETRRHGQAMPYRWRGSHSSRALGCVDRPRLCPVPLLADWLAADGGRHVSAEAGRLAGSESERWAAGEDGVDSVLTGGGGGNCRVCAGCQWPVPRLEMARRIRDRSVGRWLEGYCPMGEAALGRATMGAGCGCAVLDSRSHSKSLAAAAERTQGERRATHAQRSSSSSRIQSSRPFSSFTFSGRRPAATYCSCSPPSPFLPLSLPLYHLP